jgi:hypothetical protein
MFEPKVILLLPLPQLQLLVYHYLLPLSLDCRLCIEVLLLLDGGTGTSLSYGVQLLGVIQWLLRLGVELVYHSMPPSEQDLHHVEALLPRLHLLLLRGRLLLKQGDPRREAQPLFINVLPLPTEHIMRVVQCKMGRAHRLREGDSPGDPQNGVSHYYFGLLDGVVVNAHRSSSRHHLR